MLIAENKLRAPESISQHGVSFRQPPHVSENNAKVDHGPDNVEVVVTESRPPPGKRVSHQGFGVSQLSLAVVHPCQVVCSFQRILVIRAKLSLPLIAHGFKHRLCLVVSLHQHIKESQVVAHADGVGMFCAQCVL